MATDRDRIEWLGRNGPSNWGTFQGVMFLRVKGRKVYHGHSFREVVDKAMADRKTAPAKRHFACVYFEAEPETTPC